MRKTGSNNGKDGTFGAPKPLPGQAGYKATETDILHNETKEMEARLLILQDKLKESQIDADKTLAAASNNSGPKWKSSNPDKGSIRAYGKEVTEKFKKRIVNEGGVIPTVINPPNASLKTSAQNPSPFSDNDHQYSPPPINFSGATPTITIPIKKLSSVSSSENFSTKAADTWTVDDVSDWLRMMKLDQYVAVFQANQISGTVLLEFTLEDLDYLQITILGHRKTLLRAINELKQSNPGNTSSLNTPSLASGGKSSSNNSVVTSGLQRSQSATRMVEGEKALLSKSMEVNKKPVHWSQLEPIANNKVKGDGSLSVNAADKPHSDIFDEEAERQAFMEAVAEWRRGDNGGTISGNITIVREYEGGKTSTLKSSSTVSKPSAESGLWNNPFTSASPTEPKTSSLLSGQLDEEQEHAEFVKAVEAWRGSKRSSNNNNNNETVTPRGGVAVGETSTSPNDKTKLLAENLAKQLEREQREFLEKIEKQKQEAEKRLFLANLELEKIRRNKLIQSSNADNSHSSSASSIVIDSQAKSHDFEEVKASNVSHKSAKEASSIEKSDSVGQQRVYTYEKEPVAKQSNYNDSDDEGGNSVQIHSMTSDRPSSVKISLVESILTSPLDNCRSEGKFSPREEEEGFCVIEYESD